MIQWLGLGTFTTGAKVQSVVRELSSRMMHGVAKKKNLSQYKNIRFVIMIQIVDLFLFVCF